jgi:accessory gene regulator protein AgrB
MGKYEKALNKTILSILFSILNWTLINRFLIEIPFYKYFIIEILLIVSMKIFIFTTQKFKLQ